ncbi:MAG: hypothetical protein ACYCSH_14685 [Acidithiobacillus sp.]
MSAVSDHTELLQTWLLPGVTVLLAIATAALACFTYKMAKSTEKALEQNARLVEETHDLVESNKVLVESEERHHQENLRPICVFERDLTSPIVNCDRGSVRLGGSVVNKGHGASVEGILYLILPSSTTYLSIGLPTLGRGDRWLETNYYNTVHKLMTEDIFIPVLNCDVGCARTLLRAFEKNEVIIFIKYKDVFGNWLITKQEMNKDADQFNVTLSSVDKEVPVVGFHCMNSPAEG